MHFFEELKSEELVGPCPDSTRAKVTMGVAHLVQGHAEKGLASFEAALSESDKVAAAWLGKAHCEAMLETLEQLKFETILYSFSQAEALISNQVILNQHRAVILATLVNRNAEFIREHIATANTAREKAQQARVGALVAGAIAVAGLVVGSKSRGSFGQIAGLGAASVGGTVAVKKFLTGKELDEVSQTTYALALAQCCTSTEYVASANLLRRIVSEKIKAELNSSVHAWLLSACELFNAIANHVGEVLSSRQFIVKQQDGAHSLEIKELTGMRFLINVLSLSSHECADMLEQLMADLSDYASSGAYEAAKRREKKKKVATAIGAGVFWPLAPLAVFPLLKDSSKAALGRELRSQIDEFANYVKSLEIVPEDIDLDRLVAG